MTPTIIVTIGVGIFAGLCGAGGFWAGLRWLSNHNVETATGKVALEAAEQAQSEKIRSLVRDEYQALVEVKDQYIKQLIANAAAEAKATLAAAAELASHAIAAAAADAKLTVAAAEKGRSDLEVSIAEMKVNQGEIKLALEKIICLLEAVNPPVPEQVVEALNIARKHQKKTPANEA